MPSAETYPAVTGNWRRCSALVTGSGFGSPRPLALLGVLLVAKAALACGMLGRGREVVAPASFVVFVHEDALFFAAYAAIDAVLARFPRRFEAPQWALWFLMVLYTAVNVAVARVLSTPLTWAMLDAAGGALSDSILSYATFGNLGSVAVVLFGAVFLGTRLPPPSARVRVVSLSVALLVAVVGRAEAARVDLAGIERNALLTLVETSFVREGARGVGTAPAVAIAAEGPARDLSAFAGAARGRDVVWVILESTAAEYLGVYGATPDPTPNLSRLAERAVVFDAAYSAYPESIKGLLSMLCSIHPAPHTTAKDYVAPRAPCTSIAAALKRAGYRSAFFHSGRFRYLGMQGILDGRGFDELYDAENVGGAARTSFGTDDASTVQRLLSFVDGLAEGQRYFAVYSPISGHHPYHAPGRRPSVRPERSDQDAYFNDLHSGDVAFGELVDGFARRGRLERTLFVVVGDHGEAFGQHAGNYAHALFLYEENVRVPLVIIAPGLVREPVRAPQVASLVDIAPTTLAFLGLPAGTDHEGRSLLGNAPGIARFLSDQGPLKLGLRNGAFKCIHETEHDRTRLFDVTKDPREEADVAQAFPARAARCRAYLLDWANQGQALAASALR